jgi:hypothetical protein
MIWGHMQRKFPAPEIIIIFATEMCQSGRTGRTRNAKYGQLYQGFESLHLRQKPLRIALGGFLM